MSKHEDAIKEEARGLLEPGEDISSALIVSPRGSGTAMAGGVAVGEIGARWSNKHRGAAEDAGLVVKRNCGLALTDRRLLTLDLAISMMGGVREVKDVLSEVPIDQVQGRIADAADKVLEVRERSFADGVPSARPFELAGDLSPEPIGILARARQHRLERGDAAAVGSRGARRIGRIDWARLEHDRPLG